MRTRTRLTEELHEAAVLEQEAHEREAPRAAAEERRRIAREMHDVVAHSVSVMVVQAGGARRILDRDPARAVAAAEQIERTGREALAEMRRLLGVLHPGEELAALAPQPTLAAVGDLIERAREAGLPVELRVEGGPRAAARRAWTSPPSASCRRASPTRSSTPAGSRPRSRSAGAPRSSSSRSPTAGPARRASAGPRGGHGLVGMRERVRLYGGEMETGRRRGRRVPRARARCRWPTRSPPTEAMA